jgi:hypothetical protein
MPDAGRYAPVNIAAVYDELVRRARRHLNAGESVILDASWIDAGEREGALRAAVDSGSEVIELCCTCTDSVATARLNERWTNDTHASEATPQVRAIMAERMDAWPSGTTIDTSSRTPAECRSLALQQLAR